VVSTTDPCDHILDFLERLTFSQTLDINNLGLFFNLTVYQPFLLCHFSTSFPLCSLLCYSRFLRRIPNFLDLNVLELSPVTTPGGRLIVAILCSE
jgi:hypothetical protein